MNFWDEPTGRMVSRRRGFGLPWRIGLGGVVTLAAVIGAALLSQPSPAVIASPTAPPLLTPRPTTSAAAIQLVATPSSAVPTSPPTASPDSTLTALAAAINAVRAAAGSTPLQADPRLAAYAADQARALDRPISSYGYYPRGSTTITFTDVTDPAQLNAFWTGEYRAAITADHWRAVGAALVAGTVVVYLAEPFTFTAPGAAETGVGDAAAEAQAARIVELLNAARAAAGLGTLTLDRALTDAAQTQANDMARGQFLAHTGTDGSTPQERARRAGYRSGMIGENVLVQPYIHAALAFDGWWNSPPHYENMLLPGYTAIGITYAVAADGQVYYAMVLGG